MDLTRTFLLTAIASLGAAVGLPAAEAEAAPLVAKNKGGWVIIIGDPAGSQLDINAEDDQLVVRENGVVVFSDALANVNELDVIGSDLMTLVEYFL